MNFTIDQTIKSIVISAVAIAPIFSALNPATAAPKYSNRVIAQSNVSVVNSQSVGTSSNYLGASISGGLTDNNAGGTTKSGGSLIGRYAIPKTNLSARGGILFTDKISAITPKLTYDVGVAPGTNVYAGVGYNFVNDQNTATPLGNKNAPVLSLGVESELASNVMLFGSADMGVNAYQANNNSAFAIQGGAGFRF
jgi:hypothetical protein